MIPKIEETIHPDEDGKEEEGNGIDSETIPLVNGKKKPFYSSA